MYTDNWCARFANSRRVDQKSMTPAFPCDKGAYVLIITREASLPDGSYWAMITLH